MLFVVRRWFLLLLLYFRIINLPLLVILFAPLNPILGWLPQEVTVSGNKIRGENICLMIMTTVAKPITIVHGSVERRLDSMSFSCLFIPCL
jgi:hypothetical protein